MHEMRARWARWVVVAAVLAGGPAAATPAMQPIPPGKPPPLQPGDNGQPAPRPRSSGTGFIASEGRLLTNNHVVDGCGRMVARNAAGHEQTAHVDATDRKRDLAVLTVAKDFGPPLTFRDAPPVQRGETVVTYGFPLLGLLSSGPTLTTGNVSALSGIRDNPDNFQISAPVQPGNSGGPLLDNQANVIGVVVAKLNAARVAEMTDGDIPQNVNFAVKGTSAMDFLNEQKVPLQKAASAGADRGAAAVGTVANPSTVLLLCYR